MAEKGKNHQVFDIWNIALSKGPISKLKIMAPGFKMPPCGDLGFEP